MKLSYSGAAKADFRSLSDYALGISQAYHDKLIQELEEACNKLTKFPTAWPIYEISGRKLRVRYIHKYAIYYQIIDKTLIVEMILHTARDVSSALTGREFFEDEASSKT